MISAGTGKVPYYEGMPVPFSLLLVLLLAVSYYNGRVYDDLVGGKVFFLIGHFHPLSLAYGLFGCLHMSASIRFPKCN